MKKRTLIFTLSLILSLALKAQAYFQFPIFNANWKVYREFQLLGSGDPKSSSVSTYSITGADTTINAINYKILFDNYSQFAGGLREQSKRIYYFSQLQNKELLLYDFNVQIGDTVKQDLDGYSFYTVLDIDSVEVDGAYRKRYTVNYINSNYNPDYIIEGIGSVKKSFIYPVRPIPACTCYDYWEFICFTKNGTVKYLNPNFSDCSSTHPLVGFDEASISSSFKIYPNPVDKEFYLENNSSDKNLTLRIIDIDGKIILKKQVSESVSKVDLICKTGIYNALILNQSGQIIETIKILKK